MPAAEATAQQQGIDLNVAAPQQADGPTLHPLLPASSTGDERSRRRRQVALAGGAALIAITIAVFLSWCSPMAVNAPTAQGFEPLVLAVNGARRIADVSHR
jgi:hypothetical protein